MPLTTSPSVERNSTSSPAMAPPRPYTRAMPSPAVSTVPVSVTSTFVLVVLDLLADDVADFFGSDIHVS